MYPHRLSYLDKSLSLVSPMKLKSTTTSLVLPIESFFLISLDDLLTLMGFNFIDINLLKIITTHILRIILLGLQFNNKYCISQGYNYTKGIFVYLNFVRKWTF